MTGPPRHGEGQPWWHRPGGAQTPGRPPGYPPPQRPPVPPSQPPRHYGPPAHEPTQRAPVLPPWHQAPPAQPPRQQAPPAQPWQQAPPAQPWQQAPPAQPWQQEAPPQQPWQQAPQAPPPAKPKESRVAVIGGALVAIVLFGGLALVGGLWFSGFFESGTGTVLDVRKAEAGVQQILSDPINGYGANNVTAVKCNGGRNPQVEAGKGFTCDVSINGAQRQVQVVFRDDAGTFEVDGPR